MINLREKITLKFLLGGFLLMKHNEKSSFIGLIPLLIFVILYLGTGIFLQLQKVPMAFYQLPISYSNFYWDYFCFFFFKGA